MLVYAKIDNQNRITAVNSAPFIDDLSGWSMIDEGEGDKYYHAQSNYFNPPITDEYGVYRYKLENGVVSQRSAEEMEADRPEPDDGDRDEIGEMQAQIDMLTECLLEVSEIIYG